jgi:hypothetical protein
MMFPWKRQEVLVTNSAEQFGIAQRALKNAGIKYDTRIVNSGNNNRRTGAFIGRVGERVDLEIVYYIYAKNADVEQAKYLIEKGRSTII